MRSFYGILLSLFVSFSAHAGFMAEPWLGYESGTIKCTSVANIGCSSKTTGMNYGARLGWLFPAGLWLAADYAGGSGKIKYDAGGAEDDGSRTRLGAAFGYDMMMGFRMFGGYGFSNTLKSKSSSGETKFKGTEYYVGVGYRTPVRITINLEYHVDSLPKYDVSSGAITFTDRDTSGAFSTFSSNRVLLTVGYFFGNAK